ncbi:hypothetical protein nbrc107696_18830 [Gordonia spumicola]|uniref:Uncharacterized protein n=1 Tax=Gordonia spumicola TaxID=589161 RepID=A0A7I9V802_9ACTN|nr:hypothetical protein [Gordonia spumicola]GEE01437.1 hypothetical protein nbrc107696_18830 [Gordonia spumicola]
MASEEDKAEARGRVFAVKFIQPAVGELFEEPADQLRNRLTPGASAESYNRLWRIGKVHIADDVLTGRVGFSAESGIEEVWDDEAKDFRDQLTHRGTTTVFAVDLGSLTGLVQDRGSTLRIDSAVRALRLILNEGIKDKGLHWQVEPYRRKVALSEWKRTVTRVTKVRFSLTEPNPRWQDSQSIEDLFNATGSHSAQAIFANDAGLNVEADFIQQSQNHVERGYGDGRYTGVIEMADGTEIVSTYNSAVGDEEQSEELATNPNGEVNLDVLREHLLELPPPMTYSDEPVPADAETVADGQVGAEVSYEGVTSGEEIVEGGTTTPTESSDEEPDGAAPADPGDHAAQHDVPAGPTGEVDPEALPQEPSTEDTGEGDD